MNYDPNQGYPPPQGGYDPNQGGYPPQGGYDPYNPYLYQYNPFQDPEVQKHARKFNAAVGNLYMLIVFTSINLILTAVGSNIMFIYSVPLPLFAFTLLNDGGIGTVIGLFIAVVCIGVYLTIALLSKKVRSLIVVALCLYSIETIVLAIMLLGLLVSGEFGSGFIVQSVFGVIILVSLIGGVTAWAKLRHLPKEVLAALDAEIKAQKKGTVTPPQYPPEQYPQQQLPQYPPEQYPQQQYPQQQQQPPMQGFTHLPPDTSPLPQNYNPNPQPIDFGDSGSYTDNSEQ